MLSHFAEKDRAGHAFVCRVRIGEVLADVAHCECAKKCIDDRVDHHIAIAMGDRADALGDDNAAHDQLAAVFEAVNVVAVADSVIHLNHQDTKSTKRHLGLERNTLNSVLD